MNTRSTRTFLLLALLIGCRAPAQEAPQTLARELLREMIETDTTGEHGDTTPLANADQCQAPEPTASQPRLSSASRPG